MNRRLGLTSVALALVAATAGAFAYTEHLKVQRSPVASPVLTRFFSPDCGPACPTRTAVIGFRLRRAELVDVAIVDLTDKVVRTLVRGLSHRRGRVRLHWDGKTDAGSSAPDGAYRVRVRLDRERRTIVIPIDVNLDTRPPAVRLVSVRPIVISPDGDGRHDRATVVYRSSELAAPLLSVNGRTVARGHGRSGGVAKLHWPGRGDGRDLPAGGYELTLRVQDRAGNVSRPTRAVRVEVRYVKIATAPVRIRRGGTLRFSVETDAASFRWVLEANGRGRPLLTGRGQRGRPVRLRLPGRIAPGRYVLVVSEGGNADRVRITVGRAPPSGR